MPNSFWPSGIPTLSKMNSLNTNLVEYTTNRKIFQIEIIKLKINTYLNFMGCMGILFGVLKRDELKWG
jgi:hypothetical protein